MKASGNLQTHVLESSPVMPEGGGACSSISTIDKRPRRALKIGALLCVITPVTMWNLNYAYHLWFAGETDRALPSGATTLAQLGSASRASGPSFDLSSVTVPADEIFAGGPPKDGIPALTNPKFIPAPEARYLNDDDRVTGFALGQEARAYPLKILNYHEIVNDQVGDQPIAVTYCPLCDSVAIFDRRTPLGVRDFGVSGLIYNSNVMMYDRGGRPESLWSQIKAEGISGPAAKKPLKPLPVELTTWGDWKKRHPETTVLSPQTGHARDYQRSPYAGYFNQPGLMFPARPSSDRLSAKERVLGVWTDTTARAYAESAFSTEHRRIADQIDGRKLVIEYNPQARSLRVVEADEGVEWMYSLWFAWYAFHPETELSK